MSDREAVQKPRSVGLQNGLYSTRQKLVITAVLVLFVGGLTGMFVLLGLTFQHVRHTEDLVKQTVPGADNPSSAVDILCRAFCSQRAQNTHDLSLEVRIDKSDTSLQRSRCEHCCRKTNQSSCSTAISGCPLDDIQECEWIVVGNGLGGCLNAF